ncbi:unnamed protein product [Choristocarpus tenellus]
MQNGEPDMSITPHTTCKPPPPPPEAGIGGEENLGRGGRCCKFVEIEMNSLSTEEGIHHLFGTLGLRSTDETWRLAATASEAEARVIRDEDLYYGHYCVGEGRVGRIMRRSVPTEYCRERLKRIEEGLVRDGRTQTPPG